MKKISVLPKTWKRYKSEEYIPAGEYLLWQGRPSEEMKRIYPFIAATNGKFSFLVPNEIWTLKELMQEREVLRLDEEERGNIFFLRERMSMISLHPWQKEFIDGCLTSLSKLEAFRKGLIVGLGGGKTLVALLLGCLGRTLYIAPKHLHKEVQKEASKWKLPCPLITTPESAKKFIKNKFQVCILDECLSCKNPKTQRSKHVTQLLSSIPVVVAMTGTPMSAKKALDLQWLRTLGTIVPSEEKHWIWRWGVNPRHEAPKGAEKYLPLGFDGKRKKPLICDGYRKDEIAAYTSEYLRVVDISDIMSQIPEMSEQKILLKKPKLFNNILNGLLTTRGTQKILAQARTCTAGFVYSDSDTIIETEKTSAKIDWVKAFLEDNPDEPVVIFSNWKGEIEKLERELSEYSPAVVSQEKKEVDRFTEEKTNLLIVSASMSEGMNLQRSRVGIFLSHSSSPVKLVQAKGRLYRQGQQRGVVFYHLMCEGTLDETTLELLTSYQTENEGFIEKLLEIEIRKMIERTKK